MLGKCCVAFVVAVIGGTIMSITEVDGHSTVNDSASCESSTFDEAVNLIKQGMSNVGLIREHVKAVNLIREDLEDVKNVLESTQQQNNESSISKKDLEELKSACASSQQQNNASSSLNEAVNLIREDLEDVKSILASIRQQNNETNACASNQQPSPPTEPSSTKQALVSALSCEYRTCVIQFTQCVVCST